MKKDEMLKRAAEYTYPVKTDIKILYKNKKPSRTNPIRLFIDIQL